MIKTYSEMISIEDYLERYRYLKLRSKVCDETFGSRRYLNQILYSSPEWKSFRRKVILRDGGYDLAHRDFEIIGSIYIHHITPISIDDIVNRNPMVFDLENVVSVSFNTHQAIHYGDESLLFLPPVERRPFDTCPWKEGEFRK